MADQIRRYFTSRDMARVSSRACEGCGKCCRGMGDTVHVDPYDCFMLTNKLGRPFSALLDREIALHFEGGLMVPALRMDPDCVFLGADGRCRIHEARPGICRLFPLGRDYNEGKVRYFLLEDACPEKSRTKVRIDRWLVHVKEKKPFDFCSSYIISAILYWIDTTSAYLHNPG